MRKFLSALHLLVIMFVAFPVHAAVITFDDPDLSSWYTDRKDPAGFATSFFDGDNRLKINIAGSDVQSESFYNYQCKKKDFNADISDYAIVGDIFVDSSWTNANVGIWGTLFDSSNEVSGYPIVAWRSSEVGAFNSGFYAYDYFLGGWITLGTEYESGA